MIYVGIDLHRKRSHIAAVDEHGAQVLSRRIVNDADVFEEVVAELGDEAKFALEATYGWEWLAQLLEDRGCELHLAHPLRTKAIASARVKTDAVDARTLAQLLRTKAIASARVKTDAVDARTLAQLLRADLLPEAYIAPRELRDLRDLLRQRVVLTHMRTALKNRVHAPIARHGIQRQHSDLFGAGGRRFLTELQLRPQPRRRLDALLRLIDDFDREIAALSAEIDARATDDPRVDVLRQIRGIGRYIGLLIVAEVGDIERFPTARHLCAWAGLTPTVRSSDAKARLGHISAMGSTALRWALVEAAQKNSQSGGPLRDSFERIAKRRGRQIAKVAIVRKILTLCFYGLRDGEIRALKAPGPADAMTVMAPA